MSDLVSSDKLLIQLVNCQRVGPPYRGWDLHVFKQRVEYIKSLDITFDEDAMAQDKNLELINQFMSCMIPNGWNVTEMGNTARDARRHLGLPSVFDLNPDMAKMATAAKRNFPNLFNDRFK